MRRKAVNGQPMPDKHPFKDSFLSLSHLFDLIRKRTAGYFPQPHKNMAGPQKIRPFPCLYPKRFLAADKNLRFARAGCKGNFQIDLSPVLFRKGLDEDAPFPLVQPPQIDHPAVAAQTGIREKGPVHKKSTKISQPRMLPVSETAFKTTYLFSG